jgi:hypothetical protein
MKWSTFSFRPVDDEPTPNYAGVGAGLSLGYSARQILDIGLFANYLPGASDHSQMGKEEARLVVYGGELALRISNAVYIGLRGGTSDYRLVDSQSESDVHGTYKGAAGGISLGALQPIAKRHFFQTSLDVTSAVVENSGEVEEGETKKRRIDAISFSLTYVYNGHKSYLIESSLFNSFLDSVLFF